MAINTQEIIDKYSQGTWPTIREFWDGSDKRVIGGVVDEETNVLYYVIKNGDEITVEPAENQPIAFSRLTPPSSPRVRVTTE